MKPLSRSGFALGIAVIMLSVCGGYTRAIAGPLTKLTPANAKLWLTAGSREAPSGCPLVLTAHIRNLGKAPIYISAGLGPLQFFSARAKLIGSHRPVPWLRDGILGREMNVNRFISVLVPPGKSVRFWRSAAINRYFDMSTPGRYTIRFAAGHIKSNWLRLSVTPPALTVQAGGVPWNKVGQAAKAIKRSQRLQLVLKPVRGAGVSAPVATMVFLRVGRRRAFVKSTGRAALDFRVLQVEGPDGYNGDELVKKPAPHYIPIPNHKQVPSTTYGKWLRNHLPKRLPAKRYTLKPGVVYKYAVPINLSCQFDMSLRGTYHVRVELAHPKVWSDWIKIKVP